MTKPASKLYRSCSRLALAAAGAGSLMLMANASAAVAAEAGQPPAPTKPAETEIAEVVVTAQHRTEKLQDVPISAQVVNGQALAQQDTPSLHDLAQTLPAVTVGASGRGFDMYIRGIGSGENQSFDQSVATFIDDVYYGRSRSTAATFLDLDHIEVLKGPQSTFFGNNAIAGALNIVTKKPTDAFDASARALYGSYGEYAVEGAAGGPVSDKVDVRGAVILNGMGGWLTNLSDDSHLPASTDRAARLSVLVKPTSDLDVTLKVEGSTHSDNSSPTDQFFNCPPPAPFVAAGFCKTNLALNVPTSLKGKYTDDAPGQGSKLDSAGAELTANYRFAGHTITSVTSYHGYRFNISIAADDGPAPMISVANPETYRQFSQEVRIASPVNQPIEYMAGVYFQSDRMATSDEFGYFFLTPSLKASPSLAPYLPLGLNTAFTQDETAYSAFASAAWNITGQLKLSGGLRATSAHKSYDWNQFFGHQTTDYGGMTPLPAGIAVPPSLGTPGVLSGDRTDQALMPSAQLQYKVLPRAMAYASYSRGFKAGGFNGTDTSDVASRIPFKPEYVDAYEVGVKSQLFDNRVLLNLDAFYMNYRDLQVASTVAQSTGAIIGIVNNAGSSLSKGVEFEGQWAVTSDIRLSSNVTYLDSYYVNYPNASPNVMQQFHHQTVQSLAGEPTPYAPRWSGTVKGSYLAHLPEGYDLTTELSGFFSAKYFFASGTDDPLLSQAGYARLDGRMTLQFPNRRWAVDLIGKNLTDQVVLSNVVAVGLSLGTLSGSRDEPRSVAVQVRYRW